MALTPIARVSGTAVPVLADDVDTDQIVPARFMRCVTFDGLGEHLFHDARRDAEGQLKGHPLDDPRFRGATILIAGRNFGCGSSREHAPQALQKHGFRALVAEGFAEIFFGNCITLGIPCVSCSRGDLERLAQFVAQDPAAEVVVDLAKREVRAGGERFKGTMREGARKALLEGQWDAIGLLLEGADQVARREAALPRPQAAPAVAPPPPVARPAPDPAWAKQVNPALPSAGEVY